jgi:hypothetical protein
MNLHDALPESHYLTMLENLKRKLLRWMLWSGLALAVCVPLAILNFPWDSGPVSTPRSTFVTLLLIFNCLVDIAIPLLLCICAGSTLFYGRVMTRIMAGHSIRDTLAALTAQGLPPMTAYLLAEKAWNQRVLRRTGAVMVLCAAVVLGAFLFHDLPFWIPAWAGLSAVLIFLWSFIRFAIAAVRFLRSSRAGVAAPPPPLAFTRGAV